MKSFSPTFEAAKEIIEDYPQTYPAPVNGEATEDTTLSLQALAEGYANEYNLDLEEATNDVYFAYRVVYGID